MPAACPALEDTCPHCRASTLCELVAGGWPLTTPALDGMPAPELPQTRPVALTAPVESRLAPPPPPPPPPPLPTPATGQVLHFAPPGKSVAACGARYGVKDAAAAAVTCRSCARTTAFRKAIAAPAIAAPAVLPGKRRRRNLDIGAMIEARRIAALQDRRCACCRNGLSAERLSQRIEHCARCQRPLPGIALPHAARGADVAGIAKMTPAAAYNAGYTDSADWRKRPRRIYRDEGTNSYAYAEGWYAAARARKHARHCPPPAVG